MNIYPTEAAIKNTVRLQTSVSEYKDKPLRVYISGKNCDGFVYGVCFDQKRDDDIQLAFDEFTILVDSPSKSFIDGLSLDWQKNADGEGYVLNNPNQKKFRGKFYKRESWQKHLMNQQDK